MSSPRIRALIEEFAGKLEDVLKDELRHAIDSVGFGTASAGRSTPAAPSNGHRALNGGTRTKGIKRDPHDLEALAARFVDFIGKHPGLRIEQINAQLGTTTKDLALPIRKLVSEGRVKVHGQRRATTYSVGGARKRRAKN